MSRARETTLTFFICTHLLRRPFDILFQSYMIRLFFNGLLLYLVRNEEEDQ